MPENNEIALMYSGGLDTTYAAIELAERFKKVHLVTFCNGFCLRAGASRQHVTFLQKRFGAKKFQHTIIPISHIFRSMKKGIIRDIWECKSPLLFDLYCKLSMEIAIILYCLDKKISHVSDGNNQQTQGQIFMQREEYLKAVEKFFSEYGIEYVRQYKRLDSREEIARKLREAGIDTGRGWLRFLGISTQLFTQPFCLWAPVAFLFTSDLRKISLIRYFDLPLEKAISTRIKKEKLARRFIEYLRYNYSMAHDQSCVRRIAQIFQCVPPREKDKNSTYRATGER